MAIYWCFYLCWLLFLVWVKARRDKSIVPRWSLFGRLVLQDIPTGTRYLDRVRIIVTPWFSILLHRIGTSDNGRDLHDHPWKFTSIVLRGGYEEEVADIRTPWRHTIRDHKAGSIHRIRLDQAHTITRLHRTPTWTLIFTGPPRRQWGFYTEDGWVKADDYDNAGVRKIWSRR